MLTRGAGRDLSFLLDVTSAESFEVIAGRQSSRSVFEPNFDTPILHRIAILHCNNQVFRCIIMQPLRSLGHSMLKATVYPGASDGILPICVVLPWHLRR